MRSVVQPWVSNLTLMQQSVLFAAIRGPDGIHKEHVSKRLARWLRRCVLIAAFDGIIYEVPYDPINSGWHPGSFTGPSCYCHATGASATKTLVFTISEVPEHVYNSWQAAMTGVLAQYMKSLDELPHHYQLHFMHAAEIIGYKHPSMEIRHWWGRAYDSLANDMHLTPETEAQLDFRLADNEENWRAMEEVTAAR